MDLRHLRYFVQVVAERSFSRAAEKLRIAQPPLSRAIRQIETEVGATLIDRASRPLELTPVGHAFHFKALGILRDFRAMQDMMRSTVAGNRRRFTIGFVASTIYARLPELIREFRANMPEVDLKLIESTTIDQIAALKEGRIDVGFGRIRVEDAGVRRTVLRHETLVAAVPRGSALHGPAVPVPLAELAAHPLILYPSAPRPSYADQVLSIFRDQGLEPRVVHEARELQIAIGLVAAGEGFALVPESVRRARVDDVGYRPLADPATSPIIMSHRLDDGSAELAVLCSMIARKYSEWGYPVPDALRAPPPV